jgi:hypothetical protein
MSPNDAPVLNSLWVGNELGYLEQLCLRSALATGHHFRLFSYEPDELRRVPEGVELRDAAEVMPRQKLISYSDTGAVQLGANFWRYHLLAKGLGCWFDMDFVFVRRFDFKDEYVFGREYEGTINNAVMLAPPDSPFVRDLLELPQPNRRPPWFGPKRTLAYWMQRLRRGHLGIEDLPWGTYGPGMVTYLVNRHRLSKFVQPPQVFYPVSWKTPQLLYGPAEEVEALLTDDTWAIHMWHSRLGELKTKAPPAGSYIAKVCEWFGVDV